MPLNPFTALPSAYVPTDMYPSAPLLPNSHCPAPHPSLPGPPPTLPLLINLPSACITHLSAATLAVAAVSSEEWEDEAEGQLAGVVVA